MSNNGGTPVASLADIKARCVEVGECWEWQGAMSNARSPIAALVTQYPKQPKTRAIRAGTHVLAWEAHTGKSAAGKRVWRTCCNTLCVNPQHTRAGSQAQMSAWLASAGLCKRTPSAVASITRAKRATAAKLTMEQAREIRASTDGVIALGERYGVNKSLISRIKAGKAWRETVLASSIFSMGRVAA
jgi:hypothetical protein